MRIILYTGKGGVGKTSIAAMSAAKLAEEGKRVLIMSTDQAHSLSDSFEVKIGSEETKIAERLYGLEIDAVKESEEAWSEMQNYLKEFLSVKAENGIETEELLVFPGLEELFSLLKVVEIKKSKRYDVLIVDCAPTGETLSLLKFPEMFGTFIESVLPVKRKVVKKAGPAITKLTSIPMPKESLFDELTVLTKRLEEMQEILSDKEQVSLRIVTTAERIVIKEAKRNFTWLHLYDYNVDAIIVNRIYPQKALEGYFDQWTKLQEEGLCEIRESFVNIPIFTLELKEIELKSYPLLLETSRELFHETPFEKVLCNQKIFELEKMEQEYCLNIYLPFAEKNTIELSQNREELILTIENVVRRILLPDAIRRKQVKSAKFKDGILKVSFE